jgi:HSP20 family molecular chaperone IbpA
LKQASQAFLLENPYQPINLNRVESLASYKDQLSSEIAPVIERLRVLQQQNQRLNFKDEIEQLNRLQEYRSLDNPLITIYDRRKDEYRILVDVISRISEKIPK